MKMSWRPELVALQCSNCLRQTLAQFTFSKRVFAAGFTKSHCVRRAIRGPACFMEADPVMYPRRKYICMPCVCVCYVRIIMESDGNGATKLITCLQYKIQSKNISFQSIFRRKYEGSRPLNWSGLEPATYVANKTNDEANQF